MRHLALCGVSLLVIVGHADAQRLSRPTIDTLDHHIVRVTNAGPTAWSDTNGWKLVYERTVQPAEGSPGMLADPSAIILLPDGQLVVAQRDPAQIKLYDASGRFVRNLGHQGGGPGEYQAPRIAIHHDTLVIHDARLGRVVLMTLEGKELREFLTNIHDDGPPIAVDALGHLQVQSIRSSVSVFRSQWVRFDLTGHRLDSIIPPEPVKPKTWEMHVTGGMMSVDVPFAPQDAYALAPDGSIVYGGQDRDIFFVTRSGNDTIRMFGRTDLRAERIPAALRDSIIGRYTSRAEMRGIDVAGETPRDYPMWNELTVDDRGDTWVLHGNTDRTRRLDVFDATGRFLGSVASPFTTLWRTSWTTDHVAAVDTDDNDLPRIRIFRIEQRGLSANVRR